MDTTVWIGIVIAVVVGGFIAIWTGVQSKKDSKGD